MFVVHTLRYFRVEFVDVGVRESESKNKNQKENEMKRVIV